MDDDEDEDVVCPPGYFPIMTVHQAKGLEFDFVFVGNLGTKVSENAAHNLEQDLRQFRLQQPTVVHTTSDASWHDEIRQHFVAYSRAKYALVLMSTYSQLRNLPDYTASYGGLGGGWVRQNVPLLVVIGRKAMWQRFNSLNIGQAQPAQARRRYSVTSDVLGLPAMFAAIRCVLSAPLRTRFGGSTVLWYRGSPSPRPSPRPLPRRFWAPARNDALTVRYRGLFHRCRKRTGGPAHQGCSKCAQPSIESVAEVQRP